MRNLSIIGRIGKDAAIKTNASNGNQFLSVSVALSEGKGERQETFWYDCLSNNTKLAEWLLQGKVIHVTGTPSERIHEGKIYRTINNAQITFVPSTKEKEQTTTTQTQSSSAPTNDVNDDLPF